jgi:predicted MFS family arabinose efflux permease
MPIVKNRWVILCVLFLARTVMALQFQTVASTSSFLIDALAIDFAAIGILIGLYMLPGVVIALPGGVLGQQFGAKRIVLAGLVMMALGGALMGFGTSFITLAAGRLIAGTGAVLFNVLVTKMVADWFAGREIVTAMGILVSSWPLGLALGLMAFAPLASACGWPAVMHLGALAALVALMLVAWLYGDPPDLPAAPPARLSLALARREWVLVCLAGAIWGIFNVSYIALVSFAPDLFRARGATLAEASTIVSLIGWSLIVSIPLASYLSERIARPNLIMAASFLIGAAAEIALPFTASALAPYVVLILVIGVPVGLIMALPAQALRPQHRASGMGVFYTWYYVAMAFLPGCAGLLRDLSGSAAAPVLFSAAMLLLCAILLLLFHVAKRMPQQEEAL